MLGCGLFLFLGHVTIQTYPQWHIGYLKGFGITLGLVAGLVWVAPQIARGSFLVPVSARTVSIYFLVCAPLFLVLFMGMPHLGSLGFFYAELTSNFWSVDYTESPFTSLIKRVGMPALAHLLGFREQSYFYFWLVIYLMALGLAIRLLVEKGLGFVEVFSLLTSSIFTYGLIFPGYTEVLPLVLALYCVQRSTNWVEKALFLTLAIAAHEVAAAIFFLAVVAASSKKDRAEWLMIFSILVGIELCSGVIVGALQVVSRPGEWVIAGLSPFGWIRLHPLHAFLGILIAVKLYWLVVVRACFQPAHRTGALLVLFSISLVMLGTDASRLVQFGSLALFLLVPRVIAGWSMRQRLALAMSNLMVPSLYISTNTPIYGGEGFQGLLLSFLHQFPA